ncbi:hypothetical protein ACI2I2_01440 [Scandinavium sp. NPDC088450]|uniref:hypothetical protein n=1 Tax=Scandinavium sp. NPDC088450 TaxID=3364514 RepID=UPI00384BB881
MEQQFTEEQESFIVNKLFEAENQMFKEIMAVIKQTEAKANADFDAEGITFTSHSPANSDYLTVASIEWLFNKLHGGNKAQAQRILTMMAKQNGISLHVD